MDEHLTHGSCLCGKVTYEVRGAPLFFQYCHCSRCRKTSGSAHAANMLVPAAQFKWTAGAELVRCFQDPKAERFCLGFCSECGSKMPWVTRNGKFVLVPCGGLDEDPGVRPDKNIFVGSAAPWYLEVSSLPKFDEGA